METFNLSHENDQTVWRYTSVTKILNSIITGKNMFLVFIEADKFEDKFEGTTSKPAKKKFRSLIRKKIDTVIKNNSVRGWYPKSVRAEMKEQSMDTTSVSRFCSPETVEELLKESSFVNCWTMKQQEDMTMWDAYTSADSGVVIKSDLSSIQNSLKSTDKNLYIGKIKYIDFENEDMGERLLSPLFYKREEFKTESEVRIVASNMNINQVPPMSLDDYPRTTEDSELEVEFNTETLIDEIRTHPRSDEYIKTVLSESLNNYNIEIKNSKLRNTV